MTDDSYQMTDYKLDCILRFVSVICHLINVIRRSS